MSAKTTNIQVPHSEMRERLDAFFVGLGQGFNAYLESRSRMREFEALNAKSDAQLKAIGLRREEIARHVFRDMFNL